MCSSDLEIDKFRAEAALERAREQLAQKQSIMEYHVSTASMARAMARLRGYEDRYRVRIPGIFRSAQPEPARQGAGEGGHAAAARMRIGGLDNSVEEFAMTRTTMKPRVTGENCFLCSSLPFFVSNTLVLF